MAVIVGMVFMTGAVAVANCPDDPNNVCAKIDAAGRITRNQLGVGQITSGACWQWLRFSCEVCNWAYLAKQCTSKYPRECANDTCAACHSYDWNQVKIAGPCYDANGTELLGW